ncbi:MAG: DUF3489 domain-containing protein [Hyphomicrobium sp.]
MAALEPAPTHLAPRSARDNTKVRSKTKATIILDLLRSKTAATLADLMRATGWQAQSIRGFLSGTVSKRLGHSVRSERPASGEWRYHVEA